jgi:Ala-tRNA(Pro) deacylase
MPTTKLKDFLDGNGVKYVTIGHSAAYAAHEIAASAHIPAKELAKTVIVKVDGKMTMAPGCALGAMPPFGDLYGLEVLVARRLTEDKEIAFNAGTHTELIKLAYADFERLVKPKVLKFT